MSDIDIILIKQTLETILDEVRQLKKLITTHPPSDPLNTPAASNDDDDSFRRYVSTFECPECGADMVPRRRRTDNERFMGCENFPDCKGLRDKHGKAKANIY